MNNSEFLKNYQIQNSSVQLMYNKKQFYYTPKLKIYLGSYLKTIKEIYNYFVTHQTLEHDKFVIHFNNRKKTSIKKHTAGDLNMGAIDALSEILIMLEKNKPVEKIKILDKTKVTFVNPTPIIKKQTSYSFPIPRDYFVASDLINVPTADIIRIKNVLLRNMDSTTYIGKFMGSSRIISLMNKELKNREDSAKQMKDIFDYIPNIKQNLTNKKIISDNRDVNKSPLVMKPNGGVVPMVKSWNDNDINSLTLLYPKYTVKQLAKLLDRSFYSVQYKIKSLNLKK